jgi:MFS family permease
MPFMALYIYEVKEATAWVIAYRSTISTAVALLLSVPIGQLADKIGRKKMGYMAQVITGSSALVTVLTPPGQTEWLLLASFLASLGMTMDIGWNAFIQEYIPLDIRGRWSGLSTTVTALAGIPAPIIGGVIWNYNPDLLYWIMLIYYFIIAVPLRYFVSKAESQRAIEE